MSVTLPYTTGDKPLIGKQIREIMPQGIFYTNENGEEKFVDFAECFENHLRWSLSSYTTTQRRAEFYKQSKDVGIVNYYGDFDPGGDDGSSVSTPPYIEFHDKLGTRFEFESQDECTAVHESIREKGWYLFDLSD